MAIITVLAILGGALSLASTFPPTARELQYRSNRAWTNREQEAIELIELRRRDIITEEAFYERIQAHGFNREKSFELLKLAGQMFEVDEIISLLWRGEISRESFYKFLGERGYSTRQADMLEVSREYFPSPNDLVRFAVREVYTPDIVRDYRLDEAFPEQFVVEASKVGLSREQALNFWRAHWELPSISMGFEMFHRGVITKEELQRLMRTLDVMPFWRDRLIEISYVPYTRVDVRRMYQVGVLKKEDLLKAYMDLGYDEEKATNMMEFTIRYALPKERDLSRTMVEEAWEQGEITREEAEAYMTQLGYDEDEASLILELKENEIVEGDLKDSIAVIQDLLVSGVYTFEEALEKLDSLNLKATYRDRIYASMVRRRERSRQLPTKSDLKEMLKAGVISKEEWKGLMLRLGYSVELIELYYKLFTGSEFGG